MQKILIIEDEPPIRQQMAQVLRFEGFETLEAANGKLGVASAISSLPDLILCDIMMPEMTAATAWKKAPMITLLNLTNRRPS